MKMDYKEKIEKMAFEVINSAKTYLLTGAGFDTDSGVPDFRSPGTGLWTKYNPMQEATVSALLGNPERFYQINISRWGGMKDIEPHEGHIALAKLEKMNLIAGIFTQNISGLHIKAGSENVRELHGHLRSGRCVNCDREESFQEVMSKVEKENVPVCSQCRSLIRPNVVLFEDPLGPEFEQASRLLPDSDLLIVAGTSLQVYPVAYLPELANKLIIVNKEETPFDSRAVLVIKEKSIKDVFSDLYEEISK